MKPNYNNVSLKISAVKKTQFLNDLPQIVFCGRSNVGKSSMINCLLSRKSLARTSAKPGKTATINFYDVDKKLYFVDLPGYGYAKVSFAEKQKWAKFMEDYFNSDADKRLAISIVDIRHEVSDLDVDMGRYLYDAGIPFIVVATKADKLSKTQVEKNLAALREVYDFDNAVVIPFSSQTKLGRQEVLEIIEKTLED
ncbi:MAG: YihA family ribosome biogenesis GTP-binding protein [Clostridia bacterium]|nr:YihA family ribosome biogenesis GTP-binding protein [Clostridia bacterium]